MALMVQLLDSNIVQLILTFLFGVALYFLNIRLIIIVTTTVLSLGIFISFLLDVGEVYVYSDFYRRAFFIFEDDIGTVIAFGFLYAFVAKKYALSIISLSAVMMSGGKASIILLLIMVAVFVFIKRRDNKVKLESIRFARLSIAGLLTYFFFVFLSNHMLNLPAVSQLRIDLTEIIGVDKAVSNHRSACPDFLSCYDRNVNLSLKYRYYSSLAGLWMTLEGGYAGERYPNSSEKFADLMMRANPFGVNEKYNIDYDDWEIMGYVQNSYMSFGSGYGVLGLFLLIISAFSVCYAAINIMKRENETAVVFSIFYVVNIIFNQTQSWLMSGSVILIVLGICVSHILLSYLLQNNLIGNSYRTILLGKLVK